MVVSHLRLIRRDPKTMEDTFLYFGFGSNLLKERIHINNPSAKFVCTAKLKDYKLDFGYKSPRWMGAVATISECSGGHLWGVVWRLNKEHLESLDQQEGVSSNVYRPLEVTVETMEGQPLTVRTYQLLERHQVEDKRPSPHYLQVILNGAQENQLPQGYIDRLQKIENNSYHGEIDVHSSLKSLK